MNDLFAKNLWLTTWHGDEKIYGPRQPFLGAPFRRALWTHVICNPKSTYDELRETALICKYGGPAPVGRNGAGFLNDEFFPANTIPAGTLAVCDFEQLQDTDYATRLCQAFREVSPHYVQYPTIVGRNRETNVTANARNAESDISNYTAERDARPQFGAMLGEWAMVQCYHFSRDPTGIQQMRTAWTLQLAHLRAQWPGIKVLALVWGDYRPTTDPKGPIPENTALSVVDRHWLARYAATFFDGVWLWGPWSAGQRALATDLVSISRGEVVGWPGWKP